METPPNTPVSPQVVFSPVSPKLITELELKAHNKENDLWIAINGHVYNVSSFLDKHPGLKEPLLIYAGSDGSEGFNKVHPGIDPVNVIGKENYKGILVNKQPDSDTPVEQFYTKQNPFVLI